MKDNKTITIGTDLSAKEIAKNLQDEHDLLQSEYTKEVSYTLETNELKNYLVSDMTKKQMNAPEAEPVRTEKKIQNNEPCPCGSGKKYKKCCK